jgi:uncharacterized protein (TIGR03067 family)
MLPAILVLTMLAPPEPPKFTEAAQKELKKLEGKWEIVEIQTDGKTMQPEKGQAIVTFKGTKLKVTVDDKVQQEAEIVALDPTTKPACFDLKSIPLNAKREGSTYEAIFKIEGDKLYYSIYNGKDKKRPTGFDPPKDADTQFTTLKRVKE